MDMSKEMRDTLQRLIDNPDKMAEDLKIPFFVAIYICGLIDMAMKQKPMG